METQKLSEKELQDLKEIQTKSNRVTMSLGQVEVQKAILDGQKNDLLSQLADLQENQNKIGKELQEKYGTIDINLETGEITKVE
jgi:hypothetical protein